VATSARLVACAVLALDVGCDARALNGGSEVDAGTVETASFGGLTALATHQNAPWSIAVDGGEVFWLNQHVIGGVYKTAETGGPRIALVERDLSNVRSFALDATSVYFPQQDGIQAVARSGGAVREIVSGTSAESLVVANGFLYWEETPSAGPITVKKAPVGGGAATTIALPDGQAGDVIEPVVAASTDAVYASLALQKLARIPLDGGPVTAVASPPVVHGIAFDADTIYFAAGQTVVAMSKNGGAPQELAAGTAFSGVAVDEAFVYAVDDTADGRVLKIPKHGGAASVVAAHQGGPHTIAVDGVSIYWNCFTEGAVKRAPK
jgi:hypothetical protein